MSLININDLELKDRYENLLKKYLDILSPLIKSLEEFGRIRNELELIVTELKSRGVSYEDIDKKYEQKTKED